MSSVKLLITLCIIIYHEALVQSHNQSPELTNELVEELSLKLSKTLSQQTKALNSQTQKLTEFLSSSSQGNTKFGECPYPFTRVGGQCFFVSKFKLTWHNARHHCRGMAADLASPKSIYTLRSHLIRLGITDSAGVWLGSTDENEEGVWKWLDGRIVGKKDWYADQPNNSGGNEHCLRLSGVQNNHPPLYDDPCSSAKGFVCQFEG